MKAISLNALALFTTAFALSACVPSTSAPAPRPIATQPEVTPAPAPPPPTPRPPTPTRPAPVREPVYDSYLDAPQSPGTWGYSDDLGETIAYYGVGRELSFVVRCAKDTGKVGFARVLSDPFRGPRVMEITTETTKRTLTSEPIGPNINMNAVELDPRDPLLDAMAITKGRIAVGVEGERTLYLPAWVEISRVIEDCR